MSSTNSTTQQQHSTSSSTDEDEVATAQPPSTSTTTTATSSYTSHTNTTYNSTKEHILHTTATVQLKDGDFEGCLGTIEVLMAEVREKLEGVEVHEALAPLYYLYGSTLLYSVEESEDLVNVNADGSVADGNAEDNAANDYMDAQLQQAEDLQIAWENLDLARTIMQRMDVEAGSRSQRENQALVLDYAQVFMRLGDLQKANGNYSGAIDDFTKCLELREPVLGRFDRKVADCHYSIGTCCLMYASESEKSPASAEMQPTGVEIIDNVMAAAATASANDQSQSTLNQSQITELKERGVMHYLASARSIAGNIAIMCGVKPSDDVDELDAKKRTPNDGNNSQKCSDTMGRIRSRVKDLVALQDFDSTTIIDLKEMLDEIQETIDAADETQEIMKEHVSKMKAQAEADAEGADSKAASGSNDSSPSTVIGFGAAAAATSAKAVSAPTMMIKSKKKKKSGVGSNEQDQKKMKSS